MEGSPSHFPDWAQLPAGVVELISAKVKSICDYARFRAVCSPWRSASLPKPRHLPPQLTWLMIPYPPERERIDGKEDDGMRLFYDLWESKMRKLHLPETIAMTCCASCRGWLLLVALGGAELFLLNPITRDRVRLPSFTPPVKFLRDGSNTLDYDANYMFERSFGVTRVTFSTDPADPNCVIMVFLQRFWGLFYCRVGDLRWTMVNVRLSNAPLADATYYDGRLYMFYEGAIRVIELDKPESSCTHLYEGEFRDVNFFLLEGKPGLHVVAVRKNIEDEDGEPGQTFELYQLVNMKKFPENLFDMKKITDTSNATLFHGENHHFLAVCSDDWDSLDGDSIYVEHKDRPSPGKVMTGEYCNFYYSISVANDKMDDGKYHKVASEIAGEPPIWPPAPAMWFQPSFV